MNKTKTVNKFFLLNIFAAACSLTCNAQGKLDAMSQLTLLKERTGMGLSRNSAAKAKATVNTEKQTLSLIQLNGDVTMEQLEAEGVNILRQRGDLAIASMPINNVEHIAEMKCIKHIQLPRRVYQKMDRARLVSGIDDIQNGTGLPQAYTGKGVVCGIVDNGFEPNNINFLKDDGSTRFGYMSEITYSSSNANGYIYKNYYPREQLSTMTGTNNYAIEDYKYDVNTTYHGTHTLGIMAGSYKGNVTNATLNADGKTSKISVMQNPYYGSATEAELIASCGDLYDLFILYGIEDCLNYAEYSNGTDAQGKALNPKPCVVNLSLGSNLGPHDKRGMLNQYLAAAGKDGIICLSAGNEADYPVCLHKTFADNDTVMKSFIKPITEGDLSYGTTTYHNFRYGDLYAYSNDSTEFTIQLVVYNKKRNREAVRIPVSTNTDGTIVMYASSSDYDYSGSSIINTTFANAFEGYAAIATQLDEYTGRYYAVAEFNLSDNQTTNADGNYVLGLEIFGHDGQKIDVYGDAQYTYFDGDDKTGWMDGTADGTISDMAVADNVISVGAYNTRETWGCLDGGASNYNILQGVTFPEGEITKYSSYGTLDDGTTLPTVCAPGTAIISSINAAYATYAGLSNADLTAKTTKNGKTYYWMQSTGTSMATPVVAGAIALWLEADPNLTCDDVIDIIKTTAKLDDYVKNGIPAQWGAGKFDAYAGLQEVLRRKVMTGIKTVQTSEVIGHSCYNLQGQRVSYNTKGIVIRNGKKYLRP